MNCNSVKRIIRCITIFFATILLAVQSAAQFRPPPHTIELLQLKPTSGPPDLAVRLSADPALSLEGNPVIKVTVLNQYTFVKTPIRYFGSDAQGIIVRINWAPELSLSGNTIQGPAGFECFVGNHDLLCAGGSIPAGGSALFQFTLTPPAPAGCAPAFDASVQAKVDPYNSIGEADETNNEGSTSILVWWPC